MEIPANMDSEILDSSEMTKHNLSHSMNSHKELQRIEAFSDGVFAIACTLLVLEFRMPHLEDTSVPGALWPALKAVWPSFVAYILSFGSILVAWVGHHRAFNLLVGSSKAFL
jgi:uncharacterized membrane protein